MEYTKSSPGCYHSALKYLSELTGISKRKELILKDLSETRKIHNNKGKSKLIYPARDIFVEYKGERLWMPKMIDLKGGKRIYIFIKSPSDYSTEIELPKDTKFDKVGVVINRQLEEFKQEIKNEGMYKDSLGGGWYQDVCLFSVNGNYFAYMDCSCS